MCDPHRRRDSILHPSPCGSGSVFLLTVYEMRKDGHKDFMSPRETLLKQDLLPRCHSGGVACHLKGKCSSSWWDFYTQAKLKCCRIACSCPPSEQLLQFDLNQQTTYEVLPASPGPSLKPVIINNKDVILPHLH